MGSKPKVQRVPTPVSLPGPTQVDAGATPESESVITKLLERQRRRRGVASTITGAGEETGKTKLGQ